MNFLNYVIYILDFLFFIIKNWAVSYKRNCYTVHKFEVLINNRYIISTY